MGIEVVSALSAIPAGLRDPLLYEHQQIVQNFFERRWGPSELSGGRFCEVAYSVVDGFGLGKYPPKPGKPPNFVDACRALESRANVPRSFQILIPRILPPLYEVRNQRGVGHVGGDVDSNFMDATLVLSMTNWVLGELVRVFHSLSPEEAQALVNKLSERRIPLIWQGAEMRRVLNPGFGLEQKVLVLLGSSSAGVDADELMKWTDYAGRSYFRKLLRKLHSRRTVEFDERANHVTLLPPGSLLVEEIVARELFP